MSFRQFDIALQRTEGEQIKVRDYQEKLRLAQGQLPGKKKEALGQLAQTRDYIRKVKDMRAREYAQHGDIDRQVKGQEGKILAAAKDLARQAREARLNISKYRHAAFESKKLAIEKYNYLVSNWWDTAIRGLEESISKQQRYIDIMIARSMSSMRRAILFGGTGFRKLRVVYYTSKPMSEGERYPGREGIDSVIKRIGKIDDAERKQEAKIAEHEAKLREASASLDTRGKDAHAKVDKAVAERGKQLARGREQERKLIRHIKYLDERGAKLAGEQDRMGKASGQLTRQRGRILQGRARAAAKKKYDAQVRAYLAPLMQYERDKEAAKKAGNPPPPKPQLGPKPELPAWYKKTLSPRIRRIFD